MIFKNSVITVGSVISVDDLRKIFEREDDASRRLNQQFVERKRIDQLLGGEDASALDA